MTILARLRAWVVRTLEEWDDAQMEAAHYPGEDLCAAGDHWVEGGHCTDCGEKA